jgi:hypothetical protein
MASTLCGNGLLISHQQQEAAATSYKTTERQRIKALKDETITNQEAASIFNLEMKAEMEIENAV